jgi:hypothetical protein
MSRNRNQKFNHSILQYLGKILGVFLSGRWLGSSRGRRQIKRYGRRLFLSFQALLGQIVKLLLKVPQQISNRIRQGGRSLQYTNRYARSGFVLPTTVMVLLVVTLVTMAIAFRAFNRADVASFNRVNEATLNAVQPAIDRARVKLEEVFSEVEVTPSEISLNEALERSKYTFGDEVRLTLAYDVDGDGSTGASDTDSSNRLSDEELATTAWKFPVDTDNNGKYDTFILYNLNFRSPKVNSSGNFERQRSPLDARRPPQQSLSGDEFCTKAFGTSSALAGTADWFLEGGNLKKSFFVYAAAVPITDTSGVPSDDSSNYELKQGRRGFSGVELQQDRMRIPINNNAVVYEDDLQITPGGGINLNGRVFTNGNLLSGARVASNPVTYYQVSSPESCFYDMENSKMVIAGNVGIGPPDSNSDINGFTMHLYDPSASDGKTNKTVDSTNKPVSSTPNQIASNSQAYTQRIKSLVNAAAEKAESNDPDRVADRPAGVSRREALKRWFEARTRRVPFADGGVNCVSEDPDCTATGAPSLQGSGNTLRPPEEWIFGVKPQADDQQGHNGLSLQLDGDTAYPAASQPKLVEENNKEKFVGDRMRLGNGLPFRWYNSDTDSFASNATPQPMAKDGGGDIVWDETASGATAAEEQRDRRTQAQSLTDLGDTSRFGFWEKKAAELPKDILAGIGGMRVITGAGVYSTDSGDTFLPRPNTNTYTKDGNSFPIVWPDTMPMWNDVNDNGNLDAGEKGDLQMRTTVVYHYTHDHLDLEDDDDSQKPYACVNTYYAPYSDLTSGSADTFGNNGTSYNWPDDWSTSTEISNPPNAKPDGTLSERIKYQADLVYPSGRFVNPILREALDKAPADRGLHHEAAIDSTICSLKILDGSVSSATTNDRIPEDAIYETAFLDSRQLKSLERINESNSNNYDLPVEERQPLEIRTTVIDLDAIRTVNVGDMKILSEGSTTTTDKDEFLLPNSGIIYASRDDALPDLTDSGASEIPYGEDDSSAVDFTLDPSRRPNGIMLRNGETLARRDSNAYHKEEKGLILASNLPVYVQAGPNGGFNLHQLEDGSSVEEFDDTLNDDWSNFYSRSTLDENFACRNGDPRLDCTGKGDFWRPATVLSDAVTLLSNNFREGFRDEGDYDLRNNVGFQRSSGGYYGPSFKGDNSEPIVLEDGYDLNGDGDTDDSGFSESDFGFDLNGSDSDGDGDPANEDVAETEVTAFAVRRLNGFMSNNYVTNGEWYDSDGYPKQNSSYVTNFVTPVQRRVNESDGGFADYVMEICRKPLVEMCQPGDWTVGLDSGSGDEKVHEILNAQAIVKKDETIENIDFNGDGDKSDTAVPVSNLRAGTTALPPTYPSDRRYPRRVAFLRYPSNHRLVLNSDYDTTGADAPIILGVDGNDFTLATSDTVEYYPFNQNVSLPINSSTTFDPASGSSQTFTELSPVKPSTSNPHKPRKLSNGLWFRTYSDNASGGSDPSAGQSPYGGSDIWEYKPKYPPWLANQLVNPFGSSSVVNGVDHPILTPVLQLFTPTGKPDNDFDINGTATSEGWLQSANESTFNLVLASGDTPIRANEPNGGLPNFPRYLENWNGTTSNISGTFLQFKRSSFGSASFQPALNKDSQLSVFDYKEHFNPSWLFPYQINNGLGKLPYYRPPSRQYGFDVANLTTTPDLFSARFTLEPETGPEEFYREVARDDDWVKTLLCGTQSSDGYSSADAAYGSGMKHALPESERPASCP